ncbi:hypothetical protein [Candidimonas nitroreducens]|uniref:hypothetical protein n=1 Tax=Candidimonas nitroreducens TaxID=683354 RepID=UPI0018E98C96|nr:hypothetical protein [Candidimonas nitroreducens]
MSRVWSGRTVACIASGPSLTALDVGRVAGLPTVVTNDTYRIVPFADVLFAADHGWWQQHWHGIDVRAQKWTTSAPAAKEFGLHLLPTTRGNSGATAIHLAMERGASRILLLGYDCSLEYGSHWHGAHDRTDNPTADTVRVWRGDFKAVAADALRRGVSVVNCSRHTALDCFPLGDLLDELRVLDVEPAPQQERAHVVA